MNTFSDSSKLMAEINISVAFTITGGSHDIGTSSSAAIASRAPCAALPSSHSTMSLQRSSFSTCCNDPSSRLFTSFAIGIQSVHFQAFRLGPKRLSDYLPVAYIKMGFTLSSVIEASCTEWKLREEVHHWPALFVLSLKYQELTRLFLRARNIASLWPLDRAWFLG